MAPNPLTLIPPRAKPTAHVLLGGVLAPALPGVDLADGRPRVVCFGVDGAGVVRWRHVPAHAGDLPDLGAALRAARRGSPRTSP